MKEEIREQKEYHRISDVGIVMQTTNENCGQACVSMLANVGIEKVCKVMRTRGSTTIGQIIEALDGFGIRHAECSLRLSKKS